MSLSKRKRERKSVQHTGAVLDSMGILPDPVRSPLCIDGVPVCLLHGSQGFYAGMGPMLEQHRDVYLNANSMVVVRGIHDGSAVKVIFLANGSSLILRETPQDELLGDVLYPSNMCTCFPYKPK